MNKKHHALEKVSLSRTLEFLVQKPKGSCSPFKTHPYRWPSFHRKSKLRLVERWAMIPSGKHTKNYGKIHHFLTGTTHYFYGLFSIANCNKLPEGNWETNRVNWGFPKSPFQFWSKSWGKPLVKRGSFNLEHHWLTYPSEKYQSVGITSSTAQGGGGSFKNRKPIGGWLLWIRDGRAKPLMDRKVIEVSSLALSFSDYLPTYLPIYLSIHLSFYLSIYLSIYLSLSFICLAV